MNSTKEEASTKTKGSKQVGTTLKKTSRTGMTNTTQNNAATNDIGFSIVSSKDLCLIIKTAASCNVSELQFGPLKVSFKPSSNPLEAQYTSSTEGSTTSIAVDGFNPRTPLSEDNDLLESLRNTQLAIDDPLAFEQEMADGFLHGVIEDGEIRHRRPE